MILSSQELWPYAESVFVWGDWIFATHHRKGNGIPSTTVQYLWDRCSEPGLDITEPNWPEFNWNDDVSKWPCIYKKHQLVLKTGSQKAKRLNMFETCFFLDAGQAFDTGKRLNARRWSSRSRSLDPTARSVKLRRHRKKHKNPPLNLHDAGMFNMFYIWHGLAPPIFRGPPVIFGNFGVKILNQKWVGTRAVSNVFGPNLRWQPASSSVTFRMLFRLSCLAGINEKERCCFWEVEVVQNMLFDNMLLFVHGFFPPCSSIFKVKVVLSVVDHFELTTFIVYSNTS